MAAHLRSLAKRPGLLALVLSILAASPLQAATDDPIVTTDSLRLACRFITTGSGKDFNSNAANTLRDFCKATPDLAQWAAAIPPVEVVLSAASGRLANTDFPGNAGALSLGSFTRAATAGLPSEAVVLAGLTNFVVDRAVVEVREYIVRDFAKNLCARVILEKGKVGSSFDVTAKTFLPATCDMLESESQKLLTERGFALPSAGLVKVALKRDADTLADVVTDRLIQSGLRLYPAAIETADSIKAIQAAQRLTALAGAARLAVAMVRRHDTPAAFRQAAITMSAALDSICRHAPAPAAATAGNPYPAPRVCGRAWPRFAEARAFLVSAVAIGGLSRPDFDALVERPNPDSVRAVLVWAGKTFLVNGRGRYDKEEQLFRSAVRSTLYSYLGGVQSDVRVPELMQAMTSLVSPVGATAGELKKKLDLAGSDRRKVVLAYAEELPNLCDALADGFAQVGWITADDTARVTKTLVVVRRVAGFVELRANGQYHQLVTELLTLPDLIEETTGRRVEMSWFSLPPGAARVVQFATDAAATTDASGFESVLEHYASPVNGFTKKRTADPEKRPVYVTLNAYLGGSAGLEKAVGGNLPATEGTGSAKYGGLFAPVGLEVGYRRTSMRGFALLIQLIDVGQVASWRFNADSTNTAVQATPPGLTFASVFAPGANIVYNLRPFPIALGFGAAYAPQFRDLRNSTITAQPKASVFRTVFFAGVDVPIFP